MSIGSSEPDPTQGSHLVETDESEDVDIQNPDSGPIPYKAHTSSSQIAGTGLPTELATDRKQIENILLIVTLLVIVVGVTLLAVGGTATKAIGMVLTGVGGVALATIGVLRIRGRVKRGKRRSTAR